MSNLCPGFEGLGGYLSEKDNHTNYRPNSEIRGDAQGTLLRLASQHLIVACLAKIGSDVTGPRAMQK